MRIALITHHHACNFGAQLQTYSSVLAIQQLKHELMVIDYRPPALWSRYRREVSPAQVAMHEEFMHSHFPLSRPCWNEADIVDWANEFQADLVLTGSDAVFRLLTSGEPEGRFPNPFWLTWVDKLRHGTPRRASIAGSAHGAHYFFHSPASLIALLHALRDFDRLTVRDHWTRYLFALHSAGSCFARICPDPVMALSSALIEAGHCWHCGDALRERGSYILLLPRPGSLTDSWVRDFVALCHKRSLRVYSLPPAEGGNQLPVDQILELPMSPLEWYSWIANSAGYAGTLFHPIVSALSNRVPLVSLDQYSYRRIPLRSKVLDVLTQAGVPRLAIPERQIARTHPSIIAELLFSRYQQKSRAYASKAPQRFADCLRWVLSES